jgi:hypothetical protein
MRIYKDGTYGNRHISYLDYAEPVNVLEIRGRNAVTGSA